MKIYRSAWTVVLSILVFNSYSSMALGAGTTATANVDAISKQEEQKNKRPPEPINLGNLKKVPDVDRSIKNDPLLFQKNEPVNIPKKNNSSGQNSSAPAKENKPLAANRAPSSPTPSPEPRDPGKSF